MIGLLLVLVLQEAVGMLGADVLRLPVPAERVYHRVTLAKLATTFWTHVEVCGPVVYVRKQRDGDWHVTLDNGQAKVVAEIIPAIPLPAPKKGYTIRVRGIFRMDRYHRFAEVHPVEAWKRVASC